MATILTPFKLLVQWDSYGVCLKVKTRSQALFKLDGRQVTNGQNYRNFFGVSLSVNIVKRSMIFEEERYKPYNKERAATDRVLQGSNRLQLVGDLGDLK